MIITFIFNMDSIDFSNNNGKAIININTIRKLSNNNNERSKDYYIRNDKVQDAGFRVKFALLEYD